MRVLLVEDDALLGAAVERALRGATYAVDWVRELKAARQALQIEAYDIVLVDLGLPDGDGISIIDLLGGKADRPVVVVLSARDQIGDRIRALDLGADDYLVKPFDLDELLARLRAVRRRGQAASERVIKVGDIEFDPIGKRVRRAGEEVTLSLREYQLLATFIEKRGRVLTREQLERAIYAWNDGIGSNTVEVFVHTLRRKLGAEFIRTIRGRGYVVDE